jgi:hypothetical protein
MKLANSRWRVLYTAPGGYPDGRKLRDQKSSGPLESCVMERALKHKFPVGSTVYFTASNISRPAASGTYEVIRQLPSDGDDCQYRIKSSTEAFERVAKESQLARP